MIELPSSGRSMIEADIQTKAIKQLQRCKSMKPILSPEVEHQVNTAVAQYSKAGKALWRQWGLAHYCKNGSCILLWGPPGTGKTTLVTYLATRLKVGMRDLELAMFGSRTPGENERNIQKFFAEAKRDSKGIHIPEADSILWDRAMVTDNLWMVPVINKILTEIEAFSNLIIMTTNRMQTLDKAMERRILAKIHLTRPDFNLRCLLWEHKIPKLFPVQLTVAQRQELAQLDLSGAEIENVVRLCAGDAIERKKLPTFESLCNVAKMEARRVELSLEK